MNKKQKNLVYNLLFITFLVFLFTPMGLPVRAKLTEGFAYIKSKIIPPSALETHERISLNTHNVVLKGIHSAVDTNLNDLQGKVVFINHWATWCPPCRAEMPSLHNLYKDYGDKVIFLFITTDGEKAVDKYYDKKGFRFPTYNALSAIPKAINTTSIPATFILDKKGNVALEEFGPADWNSKKVRETLDTLITE